MKRSRKINANAQAPKLIKKIQADLKWVQTDLERVLGMSQQAVSDYRSGYVWKICAASRLHRARTAAAWGLAWELSVAKLILARRRLLWIAPDSQ